MTLFGQDEHPRAVRRTVLVVDDDLGLRELWSFALTAANFIVSTAADGEAALRVALANPPDLVITDLAMPRMDGLQLTRRLRECAATREVPIVAVTGQATAMRRRLLAAGASQVLGKPCRPEAVVAAVVANLDGPTLRSAARRRRDATRGSRG